MALTLTERMKKLKGASSADTQQTAEQKPTGLTEKDNTTPNGNATEGRGMNQVPTKNTKNKSYTTEYFNVGGVDVKADKYYGDNASAKTKAMYADTASKIEADQQPTADEQLQKDTTNDYIQSLLNIGEERAEALRPKAKETEGQQRNAPIGRYNNLIQHGWHIPSMDRDWLELAKEENQLLPQVRQAQAQKDARAQAMNDRVAEMARKRDLDAWKTYNKRVTEGGFNDLAGRQFNEARARQAANDIITDYVANGGTVVNGRVVGLPDYGGNHTGYKAVSKEAGNYSTDAMTMDTYLNELKKDLASGNYGSSDLKGKYDAEINQIQRILSGSGMNQADAEKVRIQYLYLPEEMQQQFQQEFDKYIKRLGDIARKTGLDKAQQNVNSRANRIAGGLQELLRSENPQKRGEGALGVWNGIKNLEGGFVDSPVAMEAVKEAWKAFEENLNRIAVIDPRVMYTQMQLAKNLSVNKYNNLIRERGGIPMSKSRTASEDGYQFNKFIPEKMTAPVDTRLQSRDPLPDVGSNYNNKGLGSYKKKK